MQKIMARQLVFRKDFKEMKERQKAEKEEQRRKKQAAKEAAETQEYFHAEARSEEPAEPSPPPEELPAAEEECSADELEQQHRLQRQLVRSRNLTPIPNDSGFSSHPEFHVHVQLCVLSRYTRGADSRSYRCVWELTQEENQDDELGEGRHTPSVKPKPAPPVNPQPTRTTSETHDEL
jgi:hypothetical protein